ncbi:MAG: hypothetical protein C4308_04830 [Chitinophagaceae bacterium]
MHATIYGILVKSKKTFRFFARFYFVCNTSRFFALLVSAGIVGLSCADAASIKQNAGTTRIKVYFINKTV